MQCNAMLLLQCPRLLQVRTQCLFIPDSLFSMLSLWDVRGGFNAAPPNTDCRRMGAFSHVGDCLALFAALSRNGRVAGRGLMLELSCQRLGDPGGWYPKLAGEASSTPGGGGETICSCFLVSCWDENVIKIHIFKRRQPHTLKWVRVSRDTESRI